MVYALGAAYELGVILVTAAKVMRKVFLSIASEYVTTCVLLGQVKAKRERYLLFNSLTLHGK